MNATNAADPQQAPDDRTASAIRAWVALYTKGLPEVHASERRALIEADLWEEARVAEWMGETSSLARQRLSRWVRGVPSDVTWRLEQQRRITKRPRRTDMRISKGQLAAIGVVTILYVVMIGGLLASPSFREWAGMGVATLGLGLSIVGLLLAIPRPQAGFAVGAIGTGLAFVAMPWLFPLFLPLPIVLGYRSLREKRAAGPSTPVA
jgi:hypothetical protein